MKRPFAAVGFTAFAVLLFLAFSGRSDVACHVFSASVIIGVLSVLNKNSRQAMTVPVCLFTAAFACLLFLNYSADKKLTQSFTGENVSVEAIVAEAPFMKDNGRHYCVMKLKSLNSNKIKGKIRLSFSASKDGICPESLEIGNKVSFRGKVYIPGEAEKSISRYFTAENIFLGAYGAKNFTVTEPTVRNLEFHFHRIRYFVTKTLRHGFSDKIAGLLTGILTGDKSCLDDRLYEAFRETGVAHLMAVSGLHLSLWVFSISSIIPERKRTAKLKYALLIFAVFFIMLLAGMSESVKRAGFMCIVFLFGKLSRHKSDALNSLGFAVAVMIVFNPSCVLSISLQLSFLSTLGILTLGRLYMKRTAEILGGKKISTPLKKLILFCTDVFFISISVLVFTFPVLIYAFGGISTVSAWVNMLISPVVTPLLLLSGVYVLLAQITFAAFPVAFLVKFISHYVIFVTSSFSQVKNAFLPFVKENLLLYVVAAVLIASLSLVVLKGNFKGRRVVAALSVFVCTALIFIHEYTLT